ncbi:hypothetical protein DR86_1826 [Francisella tularensis]|nr:hypothetical protein DR86_1826 [Francisella tularensis]
MINNDIKNIKLYTVKLTPDIFSEISVQLLIVPVIDLVASSKNLLLIAPHAALLLLVSVKKYCK